MPRTRTTHFVYILLCSDGTLYTGYSTNIEERIKRHNGILSGGAKYTRGRRPVVCVHVEKIKNKSKALAREIAVKKMSAQKKRELINTTQSKR